MQLLSLSCVICISGEPRRYTQRVSMRDGAKGVERRKERETEESNKDRGREGEGLRNGRRTGGNTLSWGEHARG